MIEITLHRVEGDPDPRRLYLDSEGRYQATACAVMDPSEDIYKWYRSDNVIGTIRVGDEGTSPEMLLAVVHHVLSTQDGADATTCNHILAALRRLQAAQKLRLDLSAPPLPADLQAAPLDFEDEPLDPEIARLQSALHTMKDSLRTERALSWVREHGIKVDHEALDRICAELEGMSTETSRLDTTRTT